MAAGEDLKRGGVIDLWPDPSTQLGEMGEVAEQVNLGDAACGLADARGRVKERSAKLREDSALYFQTALLRGEDFGFVFLQLWRGEALGVDESLLALVVGGDTAGVGFGDLDVVAEDGVEADLEAGDAGAAALAFFDSGEGLAAGVRELTQLVEFGVNAGANGATIGEADGRLVDYSLGNAGMEVGEGIERWGGFSSFNRGLIINTVSDLWISFTCH